MKTHVLKLYSLFQMILFTSVSPVFIDKCNGTIAETFKSHTLWF